MYSVEYIPWNRLGGVDINFKVEWMADILTTAMEQNRLACVRCCLENGADPDLNLDIYSLLANAAGRRFPVKTQL